MEIKNEVLPTEYVSLRNRSGMSKRYLEHAEKTLKNSLFKIGIYEKNELIAFGRVAISRKEEWASSKAFQEAKFF